jgi:hypothetical protein
MGSLQSQAAPVTPTVDLAYEQHKRDAKRCSPSHHVAGYPSHAAVSQIMRCGSGEFVTNKETNLRDAYICGCWQAITSLDASKNRSPIVRSLLQVYSLSREERAG